MATKHNSTQELTVLSRKAQIILHDLSVEVGRMGDVEFRLRKALKNWRISTAGDGQQFVILPLTPELLSLLRDEDKLK
jgi:hypothetical protein